MDALKTNHCWNNHEQIQKIPQSSKFQKLKNNINVLEFVIIIESP